MPRWRGASVNGGCAGASYPSVQLTPPINKTPCRGVGPPGVLGQDIGTGLPPPERERRWPDGPGEPRLSGERPLVPLKNLGIDIHLLSMAMNGGMRTECGLIEDQQMAPLGYVGEFGSDLSRCVSTGPYRWWRR